MEPVGVGLRAVSTIVDTVLLSIVGYVIAAATGSTTEGGFALQGGPFFLWLLISAAYYTVLEALYGATLGKRLIRLKVVKADDGAPIGWDASIVRNVLRLVDGFVFYLVAAILVWSSKKKQRLGDRLAGTIVVRRTTA